MAVTKERVTKGRWTDPEEMAPALADKGAAKPRVGDEFSGDPARGGTKAKVVVAGPVL